MGQEERNPRQPGNPPGQVPRLAAVILAAGRSRRMGQAKLVLPWGGTTVLGHVVTEWRKLGLAQLCVVISPGQPDISRELDRLGVDERQRILNEDPDRGMFSSVQTAAAWGGWKTEITHWAIVLGDQPQLQFKTLEIVAELTRINSEKICQPAYCGKRGHPVILPGKALRALGTSSAPTLRDFLAEFAAETVVAEVGDPQLHVDLDTPEDYATAQSVAFPGVGRTKWR